MLITFVHLVFLIGTYIDCAYANTALCPNTCSSHGTCSLGSSGECSCFPGFGGADCSLRLCPGGKAWVDIPSGNNTAHNAFTECSNMVCCLNCSTYLNRILNTLVYCIESFSVGCMQPDCGSVRVQTRL